MDKASNIYKKKLSLLRMGHRITQLVLAICSLAIAFWFVRSVYFEFTNMLEKNHVPVAISDLVMEEDFKSNETVSVGYGETTLINNIPYTYVSIGDITTMKNNDLLVALGENSIINTDIYTLTFKPKDDYILNRLWGDEFIVVHYGIFGQRDFTEDEKNYYGELAAEYFTYAKYKTLHYEDGREFVRVDENIEVKMD